MLPQLFLLSRPVNILNEGEIISQVRSQQVGGSVAIGRELGTWGQVEIGLCRFTGDNTLQIGTVGPDDRDVDGGELFGRVQIDTLDDFYFPKRGARASFTILLQGNPWGGYGL